MFQRANCAALSFEVRGVQVDRPMAHLPQPPITNTDRILLSLGFVLLAAFAACGMRHAAWQRFDGRDLTR